LAGKLTTFKSPEKGTGEDKFREVEISNVREQEKHKTPKGIIDKKRKTERSGKRIPRLDNRPNTWRGGGGGEL